MDTVERPHHTVQLAVNLASVNALVLLLLHQPYVHLLALHPARLRPHPSPITVGAARASKARHAKGHLTETAARLTTTVERPTTTAKHPQAANWGLVHARELAVPSLLRARRAQLMHHLASCHLLPCHRVWVEFLQALLAQAPSRQFFLPALKHRPRHRRQCPLTAFCVQCATHLSTARKRVISLPQVP
jgi:hypothetical protein